MSINFTTIISDNQFEKLALETFYFQAEQCSVYAQYLKLLGVNSNSIFELENIPFLPISFFKTKKIISGNKTEDVVFKSSGTGGEQSQHYVSDIKLYKQSYLKGFELFYGNIEEYCILALLPSYLEREGSSLIFMANDLINKSKHSKSGFYLSNLDELAGTLKELESNKQKTILLGVSYSLLDLAERHPLNLKYTVVMETGGMKGKRKEIVREELHQILCDSFGVKQIHSEYGMTELLSQAYSKRNGIFETPPWMRVITRDVNDAFQLLPIGKTGGINVIDLANYNSCSFIATQDLGCNISLNQFKVIGRFDNSDIRGCNLLVS